MNEQFPKNFFWGTATASYQIEGAAFEDGKSKNIWDTFSHVKGNIFKGENGDVACDHYHKFEEDIDLMAQLGVNSYRFSLSWSRILPDAKEGTTVNLKGAEFYNKLIDKLLSKNIIPMITLYHWDLPQVLQDDNNGFLSRDIVLHFKYYAKTCFELFGDRVKHWITFNEPWCTCNLGFGVGLHAPGRRSNGGVEPYIAAHHLLLAHAEAYHVYKNDFYPTQKGLIGITLNSEWFEPVLSDKNDAFDQKTKEAALRAMDWTLGWFAEPVYLTGDYPEIMRRLVLDVRPGLKDVVKFTQKEKEMIKGSSDFFGLNHYSTQFVYHPRGFFDRIRMNLLSLKVGLTLLMTENASFGKAFSIATTVLFKPNYVTDIGAPQTPYFSSKKEYAEWEQPNYGASDMGWKIVPFGFRKLISYISEKYHPNGGIIITENGMANREKSLEIAMQPEIAEKRIKFFEIYLKSMRKAMDEGADVRGYFAWSFLDNFEWSFGYEKRFGLVHVDYKTQVRTMKPVCKWFKELVTTNKIPSESNASV